MNSLRFAALFALVVVAAHPSGARADAYVSDVAMRKSDAGRLLVDFNLREAASPRLKETLDSGLPVRFSYRARTICEDFAPWNRTVGEKEITRVLEKDNLKNRFFVTEGETVREYSTFEEAAHVLERVEGMNVVRLSKLEGGGACRVEIQAKLEEFRLPFHLHRILPFVGLWDIQTPWQLEAIPEALRGSP